MTRVEVAGAVGLQERRPTPRARNQVPHLPAGAVERRVLLDRLETQGSQILLVCAPAGFGKTTLLAQWSRRISAQGHAAAWVTCTDRGGGPAALFADLREALALALKDVQPRTSGQLMELAEPTSTSVESELDALLMLLDELRVPLDLVVDDLHVAQAAGALPVLESLAVHLPDTVRLALGSRVEPQPLATNLRLRGGLLALTEAELALTRAEVAEVVAESGGDALTDDLLSAAEALTNDLMAQTDGWPAAVRLGVLAARGTAAGPQASPPLSDNPAISDYLTREVESALPGDALALLRDTAVVSELTPRLAAALSGRADAGEVLQRLFRAQALVRRIGSGEPVFVVHALLRAHLLARLAALDVDAPKRQHARAARWLADEGLTARALDHAVAAEDRALTANLLRSWGPRLLLTDGARTIVDALATVPDDLWDSHLAGLAVLARAESGDLAGARAALVRAGTLTAVHTRTEGASPADQGSPPLLRIAQFHVRRLEGRADDPELPEAFGDVLAWRLVGASSADALDRHLLLLVTRGQWAFAAGRYDDSWRDLQLALDLASTYRRDRIALQAMSTLAGVPALVGDAAGADRYATDALSLIEGRGWATHPALANLYTAGAWAASLMLEPHRAEQMMGRAFEALRDNVDPEYAAYAGMVEATLFAERTGDPAPAMALLARLAQGGAATQVTPGLRPVAAMSRVRIMLKRADILGAEAAIADFRRWFPGTADPLIARAQLKAAQGLWKECLAALGTVGERALPVVTPLYHVVLPLLESVAKERLGQRSSAQGALLRTLAVAAPRGVVRPFWEAGPTMRRMLERQRGQFGAHEDFVATVLLRWDAVEAAAESKPVVADVDGVALTPRELEVLRALPSLSTAEELAAEQVVTVNTIRTHMRALYRKLGVRTRRDAVRRGRELGLL